MRVGFGFDAHAFSGMEKPLVVGGETVHDRRGVDATSDGDVVAHATADALLGALALGDLGVHYPSTDTALFGADSMVAILGDVSRRVREAGWEIGNLDVTVIAESVRIAPHRENIRQNLATVLGANIDRISVKATTTDGLGFTGREQGVSATAVVLLESI